MLKVTNLTKKFGNKIAVDDLTLSVKAGEIYCLIGPNGSGKTTFIKTVAGLLQPTAGKISVDGFDVEEEPEKAKAVLGYVPDEPAAWNSITGEEFLHIVGALYSLDEKERSARLPALLSLFRLQGIEHEYFEDYSRGNKQKFSILTALLHRPKLLLIDEPIVGLDPISADTAKKQFVEFARGGGAILMVTHTLSVAEQVAGRIGFIENGRLKASGTLAELRSRAGLPAAASLEAVYKSLA